MACCRTKLGCFVGNVINRMKWERIVYICVEEIPGVSPVTCEGSEGVLGGEYSLIC
jgi:hypothetical protein